jgi:hypothetical protein
MKTIAALSSSLLFAQSAFAALYGGPIIGAVGVGVSNLTTSVRFYKHLVDFSELTTFKAPDWTETILVPAMGAPERGGPPPSASLVLMQWDKPKTYGGSGNKLVFYVDDFEGTWAKLGTGPGKIGGGIAVEPKSEPSIGGLKVGFGLDPDGTWLEIQPAENLLNITALVGDGPRYEDDPGRRH